jgi:hypothetical protein
VSAEVGQAHSTWTRSRLSGSSRTTPWIPSSSPWPKTEEATFNALVAGLDITGFQSNNVRGLPKTEVQVFLKEHALLR